MVINSISKIFSSPSKAIVSFIIICLILCLPYSFPLLVLTLIGYGIGRLFGLTGAKALTCGLAAWLGLFVPLGHILAKLGAYGPRTLFIIIIFSVCLSLFAIYKNKNETNPNSLRQKELNNNFLGLIWPLLVVIFCLFLYTRTFWITSMFNASPPTIFQTALHMMRSGKIHFLTPQQDVFDTFSLWYPNLLSHLSAFGLVFLKATPENVMRYGSLLGAYLTSIAFAAWVELFSQSRRKILNTIWSLTALMCTYAFFRIAVDMSVDTVALMLIAAFFGWIYYFYTSRSFKAFLGLVLNFIALCWFRQFAGPIIALTFVLLFCFKSWRQLVVFSIKKFKFIFFVVLAIALFMASLWYVDVYKLTGRPFYPFGSNLNIFKAKSDWPNGRPMNVDSCRVETKSPLVSAIKTSFFNSVNLFSPAYGVIYSFFSIDEAAIKEKKVLLKLVRGLVFGYTVPTAVTVFFIIGLISFLVNKRGKGSDPGPERFLQEVSFVLIVALCFFIAVSRFYYKMLYMTIPAFLILAYAGFKFLDRFKNIEKLLKIICWLQVIIFLGLFFYRAVGTSPDAWAIPRYIASGDPSAYNSLKAYSYYQAAQRAKVRLKNYTGQVLHFHNEPGMEVNFYLDKTYYWQDLHYHNCRKHQDLYKAMDEDEVLEILRRKNIKVFILTGKSSITTTQDDKHLIYKMLFKDKHQAFDYDEPFAYLKE